MVTHEDRLASAALNLRVDSLAAEVVTELRAVGVRALLLKGPSVARSLYDVPADRPYRDVDLLVDPADRRAAERVLRRLGLVPEEWRAWLRRARAWYGPRAAVDLHTSLFGVGVPSAQAWSVLSRATEPMAVGGVDVEILAPAARTLHVALHAAQHPPSHGLGHPAEDLARALERVPLETWRAAASIAEELGAEAALASGLRSVRGGDRLARTLGVGLVGAADVALHAADAPWPALGFAQIAAADSFWLQLVLVGRAIVPPRSSMRTYSALAARGEAGLWLAYVTRTARLARQAPSGFAAWRRARR